MTNQERLKAAILATRENEEELNSEQAWDRFADKIAAAVIAEIKALQINYIGGLVTGGNAVTGVINHTIS